MNPGLPQDFRSSALAVGAFALLTIGGAWAFQIAGYPPCDLCYLQRYAYYAGIPLAAALAVLASGGAPRAAMRVGLLALALIFAANSVLAIYHSGVEAQLWKGPTACTGSGLEPGDAGDLLKQLETTKIVRCDAVNLRVFGLSLANWNIFISGALAGLAARATLLKA